MTLRLAEQQQQVAGAFGVRKVLQDRVEQVQEEIGVLKMKYDNLLEQQKGAEQHLREENVRGGHLVEDMIHLKQQAAARMNSRNERKSRYHNMLTTFNSELTANISR